MKRTYTTPPGEILTNTPGNDFAPLPGATLAQFLTAAKIPAQCVNVTIAPQIVHYDINLLDILQYNESKLKRLLLAFSARHNTAATLTSSTVADFAIDIVRTEKAPLYLKTGIYTNTFNAATRSSSIAGIDTNNRPVTIDIAAAPHVLIAGTTGSGKSVLLNSLICSLLYKITPATGRLLMIDPKQVELSIYEGLPHLYRPIVKGAPEAITALAELCEEMDKRYKYMAKRGAKSIADTNMPRIYCIIDELADLMLTSKKTVESYIIRIAQLGRAAGIHLIVATQRPTVNIITGLIKANISTKIALAVSNVSDSITILNHGGAEKLTGRGDAIIKTPDKITERRFQSFYTPDEDIQAIVNHYRPPRRFAWLRK